jgi:hypothetical protein
LGHLTPSEFAKHCQAKGAYEAAIFQFEAVHEMGQRQHSSNTYLGVSTKPGQVHFWNGPDLRRKLDRFAAYYNQRRVHAELRGRTPSDQADATACKLANLHHFAWRSDCSGLFHTPIAA